MIKVLVFAGIQEKLQAEHIQIAKEQMSIAELKEYLIQTYPALENEWRQALIALNQEFATEEQMIVSADEVAIIPPVSGG